MSGVDAVAMARSTAGARAWTCHLLGYITDPFGWSRGLDDVHILVTPLQLLRGLVEEDGTQLKQKMGACSGRSNRFVCGLV